MRHSQTDERYERSAARVGSMLKNDMTDKIMEKNEALAFYNFAESLREQGLRREADLQFAEAAQASALGAQCPEIGCGDVVQME